MNIIEFLKKGSGIHIKPENKGLFTKYCNGKVTSECIARGKRSSDPAVRKRATFADNSRHFKHKLGGLIIKAQEGSKTNWFGNFLNSDTGRGLISGLSNIAVTAILNKKASSDAEIAKSGVDMQIEELKKQSKMLRRLEGLRLLLNTTDPNNPNANGGIFQDYFLNLYMNQDLLNIELSGKNLKALIDDQTQLLKSSNLGNTFGSIILNGLGLVGNYLSSKSDKNSTPVTSNYLLNDFWKNPSLNK